MPTPLRDAYAAMLPRLEAEHDLRIFTAMAAAGGSLKKNFVTKYLSTLTRQARPPRQRKINTVADLEAAGITVIREVKHG